MSVRLRMYKCCYSNLNAIYAKGLFTFAQSESRCKRPSLEMSFIVMSLSWKYDLICSVDTLIICGCKFKLTKSPAPSGLDSSVGRALHRYRRGLGLNPVQA